LDPEEGRQVGGGDRWQQDEQSRPWTHKHSGRRKRCSARDRLYGAAPHRPFPTLARRSGLVSEL